MKSLRYSYVGEVRYLCSKSISSRINSKIEIKICDYMVEYLRDRIRGDVTHQIWNDIWLRMASEASRVEFFELSSCIILIHLYTIPHEQENQICSEKAFRSDKAYSLVPYRQHGWHRIQIQEAV